MSNVLEQIDELIAVKRQELKNLLFARDAITSMTSIEGAAVPADIQPLLALASGNGHDTSPRGEAPRRRKKADKAARKDRIKAAAEKKKGKGGRSGTRRKFSKEFKLQVLKEVAEADKLQDVLDKHGLYPSHITTWTRQKEEGRLDPSAGAAAPPAAAPDLEEVEDDSEPAEEDLDVDEFEAEPEPDDGHEEEPDEDEIGPDDEEEEDLVDVLGPQEEAPTVPFDQDNPEDLEKIEPKVDPKSLD